MIEGVTDGRALPKEIAGQIIDRTDGVPLFIEELTKAVVESRIVVEADGHYVSRGPLATLAIPATLQASLLARLDRLPAAREVAQTGAALGRSFSYELINAVAQLPQQQLDDALTQLVSAELIFRRGAPPDAEYSFKHVLVQDVAHATLLRGHRQQLHARIVGILERQFPEIVDMQPEVVAWHCSKAALVDKAIGYWLKAGRRAIARAATMESVAQVRKGLALLSGLPDAAVRQEQELELQIILGYALLKTSGYAAPQPSEAFARARAPCERLNRPPELGVLVGQFTIHLVRGELEQAERYAGQVRHLGEDLNSLRWKRVGCEISGCNSLYLGKFMETRAYYENWLSLRDPTDCAPVSEYTGENWSVVSLVYLSKTLLCLGYIDQARLRREEALAEARRRSPYSVIFALSHASFDDWLIEGSGSASSTFRSADEILAISREYGFPLYIGVGNILLGFCLKTMQQPADGISLLVHGLATYRDTGARTLVPFFLTMLAAAYGTTGQPDEGLNRLSCAAKLIETTKERWAEAEMHRLRGDLLIAKGNPAAAERSYRQALSTARKQSAKLLELRAATNLAHLWRHQGKEQKARNLLAPVCGWFTEGFNAPVLEKAKALLDQLST
jgi:predicted ATPase